MITGIAAADEFAPNPWNPNKMTAAQYAQLLHDIREFGFLDPLTVRPHPDGVPRWQIIDGENRWRAARDLGIDPAYTSTGTIDDAQARKLTIILNELRGQYDPRRMGDLLEELLKGETPAQLLETVPFTEEALAGLVGLKDFDWKGLDKPASGTDKSEPKWIERTFRMPPDANAVLDDALVKVKESQTEDVADWQALEMLAADFLSG